MSILDQIFKKEPTVITDGLTNAFTDFFNAKTHAEERKILEQYPGLLDDAYENLFKQIIEATSQAGHPELQPHIQSKYDILRSCRKNGIAKTFASKPDLDIASILINFVQTTTWAEARHLLEHYPELYSGETMRLYNEILNKEGDSNLRELRSNLSIIKHAAILRRCRQKGVERAIHDEINAFGPKKLNETEIILTVITSRERGKLRKMLELSPELLIGNLDEPLKQLRAVSQAIVCELSNQYIKGIELLEDCRRFNDIEKGLTLFVSQNPGYLS